MTSSYPSVTAQAKGNVGRPNYRPTPRIPTPANDNTIGIVRRAGGRAGAKIGGRLLARFIPYVGIALTAYDVYQLWQYASSAEQRFPSEYWVTTQCPFPGGALLGYRNTGCIANSQGNGLTANLANPTTWSRVAELGVHPVHGAPAYQSIRYHTRKADAPYPTPTIVPGVTAPVPLAPVDAPIPASQPLAFQAPFVDPKVWEAPKVGEEPQTQPQKKKKKKKKNGNPPWNDPDVLPAVPVPFFKWPRPFVGPDGAPTTLPGTVVTVDPWGDTIVERDPDLVPRDEPFAPPAEPVLAPPSSPKTGGKRKPPQEYYEPPKTNYRVGLQVVVWGGLNTVTEVNDFVIAMHESITNRSYKLNDKASKAQKLQFMYSNIEPWKHIDPALGLQNFINMQIGDFIAALGSETIKRGSRTIGSQTGLDRLLRNHQDGIGGLDTDPDEEGVQRGKRWDEEFVPEIDIDPDTWEVRLVWK